MFRNVVLSVFFSMSTVVFSGKCTPDKLNGYDVEKGYKLSKKIQELLAKKDLTGIYELVAPAGLINGARKKYALQQGFNKVFPPQFAKTIIDDPIDCEPVGWRGFMLGRGKIWHNGHYIISINSPLYEPLKESLPRKWIHEGSEIDPGCFAFEWVSSDNFEEFAEMVAPRDSFDYKNFFINPGLYLGREIKDFSPIVPSWEEKNNPKATKISFVFSLNKCKLRSVTRDSEGGAASALILRSVSPEHAKLMAPFLKGICHEAFLLKLSDEDNSGTLGQQYSYGVFARYDLPSFGQAMVPLKYFNNQGPALDFIEGLSV